MRLDETCKILASNFLKAGGLIELVRVDMKHGGKKMLGERAIVKGPSCAKGNILIENDSWGYAANRFKIIKS